MDVFWWVATYAAGGLISFAIPRLLIAAGLPLDRWIVLMGSWVQLRVNPDVAIWSATAFLGVVLYATSVIVSSNHSWDPQVPEGLMRAFSGVQPVHLIAAGLSIAAAGAIWQVAQAPVRWLQNDTKTTVGSTTVPDPVREQVDRLARIAFITDTLQKFETVQSRLQEAKDTRFKELGRPHWTGQTIPLMRWYEYVNELQRLYKDFSGKDVDLQAAPNFTRNPLRPVPGDDATPSEERKGEFRRFYDQVTTSDMIIPKLRREMIDELNGLKAQAYTTRVGPENN
jgi:hypothetical protein